jgi:hypothetical protein
MKTILLALAFATFGVAATFADDKTVTTTTATYGSGTIAEYTPGTTIVVKETSGPVSYKYGEKVTYVTKSGKVLTEADVKSRIIVGAPVRVYYGGEGQSRVVNKVEIDD